MITAFVENYPPGIVGCEFTDINGRICKFEIKFYDISDDELNEGSVYPVPGVLGCDSVLRMTDEKGRSIAEIETSWASVDGVDKFRVSADQLTEDVTMCFVSRNGGECIPLVPSARITIVTAERKKP
jgi:hypothetical protein